MYWDWVDKETKINKIKSVGKRKVQTEIYPGSAYPQPTSSPQAIHLRFSSSQGALLQSYNLLEQAKGLALDFTHKSLALVFTNQKVDKKIQ